MSNLAADAEGFRHIRLFGRGQRDYYPLLAQRHYDRQSCDMPRSLGAEPGDLVLDATCRPGESSRQWFPTEQVARDSR